MDQVLWVGKGVVGRVGLWEGRAAQALFADAPEAVLASPPTCPFQPTFLCRSAPSSNLAVLEIAEQGILFFVGNVHEMEICKGDNVDADSEIHFAMSGVAPQVRPTTMWHLLNRAPAWLPPKCTKLGHGQSHVHVIARCACLCGCLLHCQIGRNSHEICTKFVPMSYGFHVNDWVCIQELM